MKNLLFLFGLILISCNAELIDQRGGELYNYKGVVITYRVSESTIEIISTHDIVNGCIQVNTSRTLEKTIKFNGKKAVIDIAGLPYNVQYHTVVLCNVKEMRVNSVFYFVK